MLLPKIQGSVHVTPNITIPMTFYFNPIQDGLFCGLLTDRGVGKKTPTLKSVTHILQ